MPTKYLTGRVRRGGSPRRSLKFEGGKEDDGHEIGKHVGKRTKKKTEVGYCRYTSERKILAADSCRGSAARAMQASQPDPQRSIVEF